MSTNNSVTTWAVGTGYDKNDIVKPSSDITLHYYAREDHTSGSTGTSGSSGSGGSSGYEGNFSSDKYRWDGVLRVGEVDAAHFFWKPDYGTVYTVNPRVKKLKFGDSYTQRTSKDVDNIILKLDLKFTNRNEKEISAIVHFLNLRKGYKQFVYIPPDPYATLSLNYPKRFICRNWDLQYVFKNSNSLNATFEEVPRNNSLV